MLGMFVAFVPHALGKKGLTAAVLPLHCSPNAYVAIDCHEWFAFVVYMGRYGLQVGPYDHTVQKPFKGSVLAYWQAEEGLKAGDNMKQSSQDGELAPVMKAPRHPPRQVDSSGSHLVKLEAGTEAGEPSAAPEVSLHLSMLLCTQPCALYAALLT